jgi:hypothetical protein
MVPSSTKIVELEKTNFQSSEEIFMIEVTRLPQLESLVHFSREVKKGAVLLLHLEA